MRIQVNPMPDAAATAGAKFIADQARNAVAAPRLFVMAVSGGHVPWQMFRILASRNNAVEGRACDAGGRASGAAGRPRPAILTHLRESLLSQVPLPSGQFHAMPVEEMIWKPPPQAMRVCSDRLPVRRRC